MSNFESIGFLLILINFIISYKGFKDAPFFERYLFHVDAILLKKEYGRLVSSGFLHLDWTHLLFNMFSLYFFSGVVIAKVGALAFLLIYFASLIGGNLLSLFIHRLHSDYSAVGASGAVCGIIFSFIALYPGSDITFFGIINLPSWLYGLLYVGISIYGIKSAKDNVGHDAHLGGALVGLLVSLMIQPSAFAENYITILVITIPTLAFLYIIITKPHVLLVDNLFFKKHQDFYSIDHRYNIDRANSQQELDAILDKIGKKGMNSLSKKEKQKLDAYSKKV